MFQSHTGSIKRPTAIADLLTMRSFNPTLVRLKAVAHVTNKPVYICFNPTLVRLKVYSESVDNATFTGFNPTLVRLKVILRHGEIIFILGFNPTLVRLKVECRFSGRGAGRVSIPHWFD